MTSAIRPLSDELYWDPTDLHVHCTKDGSLYCDVVYAKYEHAEATLIMCGVIEL